MCTEAAYLTAKKQADQHPLQQSIEEMNGEVPKCWGQGTLVR